MQKSTTTIAITLAIRAAPSACRGITASKHNEPMDPE